MNLAVLHAAPDEGCIDHLPHQAGPASDIRQVLAAHFLRDCPHVLEIGGYTRPVTPFLTHRPLSVTSIDPKTPHYESDTLNGAPCRVRHIAKKFQEVELDHAPGSYGLVLLGYSLKPFGSRQPVGGRLLSLIDNARRVVIDHAPALERAAEQVPALIQRSVLKTLCSFTLTLDDAAITGSPYAARVFTVLEPAA